MARRSVPAALRKPQAPEKAWPTRAPGSRIRSSAEAAEVPIVANATPLTVLTFRPPVSVGAGLMRIIRSPVMRSCLLVWAWIPRGDVPAEEVAHEPSNQVAIAFQREVAGIE